MSWQLRYLPEERKTELCVLEEKQNIRKIIRTPVGDTEGHIQEGRDEC